MKMPFEKSRGSKITNNTPAIFVPTFEHDKTQPSNLNTYIRTMIEDEAYRTSSQYRNWSYTRESLASLRQSRTEDYVQDDSGVFARL